MEAATKRGRPATISKEERERLLAAKGMDSERWALDKRFMEAASKALEGDAYPFILPPGKKPRSSLLVELGRWKDVYLIQKVAKMIEEAASKNNITIKEAISLSRDARKLYPKDEAASKKTTSRKPKDKVKKHTGKEEKAVDKKLKTAFGHTEKIKNGWKEEPPVVVDAAFLDVEAASKKMTSYEQRQKEHEQMMAAHIQQAAATAKAMGVMKPPRSVTDRNP
jgi:hypothetical protein